MVTLLQLLTVSMLQVELESTSTQKESSVDFELSPEVLGHGGYEVRI